MANLSFTATGNVSITGITPTPATAPKPTISVAAAFNSGATNADDYLSDTYTVNAGTTATAVNLGKISAGLLLAVQTTGTVLLTITQDQGSGPVDIVLQVDSYILLESGFSALKIANAGATAVQVSISVVGNRPANSNAPGVF